MPAILKGSCVKMSWSSTPSRSSCVVIYGAYELDACWYSDLLERRGGEGVDELLEMMGIVEREEVVNRVKREDVWGPVSRFQNSLCLTTRYSVLPYTLLSSTTTMPATSRMGTYPPAHQVFPSTPVDPRARSLSTRTLATTPGDGVFLQPPIQLTHPIQYCHPTSHLPDESPRSSPAVRPESTPAPLSPTRTWTPQSHRLTRAVSALTHIPVVPGCARVVLCIDD